MQYNKIELAGNLLLQASREYRGAESDVEYAKCILLGGAVIGMVAPLLKEKGVDPSYLKLANLSIDIKGIDSSSLNEKERRQLVGKAIGFYKAAYNALKHTGNGDKLAPSDDMYIEADLKSEAFRIIGYAISDFRNLDLDFQMVNQKLPIDLLTLIQSSWDDV